MPDLSTRETGVSIKPGARAPGTPGKTHQARGVGDSLKLTTAIARFAGSIVIGALILGLTPQALCWRPLSRTDFLLGDSHPDLTVGAIA